MTRPNKHFKNTFEGTKVKNTLYLLPSFVRALLRVSYVILFIGCIISELVVILFKEKK